MDLRVFFRTFRHLDAADKSFTVFMVLARLMLVGLDLAGIVLVGVVVSIVSGTVISPTSNLAKFTSFISGIGLANNYIGLAIVAVLFFTLKGVISVLLTHITSMRIARLEARKSREILEKMLEAGLPTLDKYTTQGFLHGLGTSVYTAFSQTITVGVSMLGEMFLILGVSAYLAATHFTLFLGVALFFGFVGAIMALTLGKASGRSAARAHESSLKFQGVALSTLENFRQIVTSASRGSFVRGYDEARRENANQYAIYVTLSSLPRYITEIAVMLGVGLLVAQRNGPTGATISASTIAVFLAGIFRIVASMLPLQSSLSTLKRIAPQSSLAFEMLEDPSTPAGGEVSHSEVTSSFSICFRDVRFGYSDKQPNVFENLNLEIPENKYVAVVGKSGQGKSTFADLLMGLRKPDSGQISIGSVAPSEYLKYFPNAVAYVPQDTAMFPGTLLENLVLELNPKNVDMAHLEKCLEALDLLNLVNNLRDGLNTVVGPGGVELSGGQAQRVGLIRALYLKPRILILDEATSALDIGTEQLTHATLTSLKGQATIVVIAHRPQTLKDADLIFRVESGGISVTSAESISVDEL